MAWCIGDVWQSGWTINNNTPGVGTLHFLGVVPFGLRLDELTFAISSNQISNCLFSVHAGTKLAENTSEFLQGQETTHSSLISPSVSGPVHQMRISANVTDLLVLWTDVVLRPEATHLTLQFRGSLGIQVVHVGVRGVRVAGDPCDLDDVPVAAEPESALESLRRVAGGTLVEE